MLLRGFGTQTIATTGLAQPMFGTTLTAAATPTPDMFTGGLNPASARAQTVLTLAEATWFRKGDKLAIGPANSFNRGSVVPLDEATVSAVNYGASQITVMGLTRAHASGETVILSVECASINVQVTGDPLYVGEDSTVSAASSMLALIIAAGGSFNWGSSNVANVLGTGHIWIAGTAGGTYLPHITKV